MSKEYYIGKDYVDNGIAEYEYVESKPTHEFNYDKGVWEPIELKESPVGTLSTSAAGGQLTISGDGTNWTLPYTKGDADFANDVDQLREEVYRLTGIINTITGVGSDPWFAPAGLDRGKIVDDLQLATISLVESDEYPIKESEEDKYERAMKGI